MKLNFSSLPFVKSSQTVSRNKPMSQLGQSISEEAPPITRSRYNTPIGGMRLPLDSVVVTVRRSNTKTANKRKWPILPTTSQLDDLSPPKKLKRKSQFVSGKQTTPLKSAKRISSGSDVNSHVSMIKRKQNTLLNEAAKQQDPSSFSSIQEVPVSPTLLPLFDYYDDYTPLSTNNTIPTDKHSQVNNYTRKMNSRPINIEFIRCFNDNQHNGESSVSIATDPSISSPSPLTDNNNNDEFGRKFLEVGMTDDMILPVISEEYVLPVKDMIPSITCDEQQFDPNTFGIKMIFPREE